MDLASQHERERENVKEIQNVKAKVAPPKSLVIINRPTAQVNAAAENKQF